MRFAIADTLTKSISKLDSRDQTLVKNAVYDFQVNPYHAGKHLHKLESCPFKSFEVTDSIRIVVHQAKDEFLLCFAAHHQPSYDWAVNRRIVVHPTTGAAQIVVTKEIIREVVKEVVRKKEVDPPLFDQYEKDYLLALGVPSDWLDAVRVVGDSALDQLLENLPQEAAERLFKLALGEPVPRPVAVSGDPLMHPDAQRRFRVMDSHEDLKRALDYPWDQWLVFLHPDQRQVATASFNGPARVTGSAGTGKTVVALHRIAHLARGKGSKPVLLTTFSKTLSARLTQHVDLLVEPGSKARERIRVDHIHKVARDLWNRPFDFLEPNMLLEVLGEAKRVAPKLDLSLEFLKAEWEAIIDPWGIKTWEAYKAAPRKGRGTALGGRQKQAIWKVFEETWRILASRNLMSFSQLCYAATEKVGRKYPFSHVVADECQDFGPAELTLVRALAKPGRNDLCLCGDMGQQIFKGPFSWLNVAIDVRGRSTRLKLNYRTTEQIRRFADGILPTAIDEGDEGDPNRGTVSLLNGPSPDVQGFKTQEMEAEGVAAWIQDRLKEGFHPSDIAVFGRINRVINERVAVVLQKLEMEAHRLRDDDPLEASQLIVGTMHRAKGLEFKCVVAMGCDRGLLPLAHVMKGFVDPADQASFVEQERCVLYVALTRARERVLVTYSGRPSEFVATLPKGSMPPPRMVEEKAEKPTAAKEAKEVKTAKKAKAAKEAPKRAPAKKKR